jgi:putative membrane protein
MMGFFWIILLLPVLVYVFRDGAGNFSAKRDPNEDPLDLLRRKYAEGAFSSEEFEERRARLQRIRA